MLDNVILMMSYTVVKRDRVDDHEVGEVIFVGHVVPVPRHHVERGVALLRLEQHALVLAYDLIPWQMRRVTSTFQKLGTGKIKISAIRKR